MAGRTLGSVAVLSLWALLGGAPLPAWADQAGATPQSTQDLTAPPAPAFVVLGIAPTTVERPQGVRPLVMSVIAASKDTGFPRNYAVEFAPYWLGTPKLSFDDYYANTPKNIFRQLSLSLATTPLTGAAADGTAIGFGVRTVPLPGRAHPQLREKREALARNDTELLEETKLFADAPRTIALLRSADSATGRAIVARLNSPAFKEILKQDNDLENEIQKVKTELAVLSRQPDTDERKTAIAAANDRLKRFVDSRAALAKDVSAFLGQSGAVADLALQELVQTLLTRVDSAHTSTVSKLDAAGTALALEIQELDRQRVGLLFSIAAAVAWQIPENDTKQLERARSSMWFTPGYRFLACRKKKDSNETACTSSVDALAVARYTSDPGVDAFWDMGARLVWQPRKPIAVSVEALGRSGGSDAGSRLVGVAEYQLNDTAFLYASFGRDFSEQGVRRNLVSIFGLTLGFGKKPLVTP